MGCMLGLRCVATCDEAREKEDGALLLPLSLSVHFTI